MRQTDEELLDAIALLYAHLDPAPDDLADGVLSRVAVEGLESEYELLTLVERIDHAAGTRAGPDLIAPGHEGTVALEFAGRSYRVLVRIGSADGHRRVDGWVLPAVALQVFLGPQGDAPAHAGQRADADRHGRFEFPLVEPGQVRLWLLPQSTDEAGSAVTPFVTPPFQV